MKLRSLASGLVYSYLVSLGNSLYRLLGASVAGISEPVQRLVGYDARYRKEALTSSHILLSQGQKVLQICSVANIKNGMFVLNMQCL